MDILVIILFVAVWVVVASAILTPLLMLACHTYNTLAGVRPTRRPESENPPVETPAQPNPLPSSPAADDDNPYRSPRTLTADDGLPPEDFSQFGVPVPDWPKAWKMAFGMVLSVTFLNDHWPDSHHGDHLHRRASDHDGSGLASFGDIVRLYRVHFSIPPVALGCHLCGSRIALMMSDEAT